MFLLTTVRVDPSTNYTVYVLQGPRSKFSTGGAKGKRVSVSHLGGSGGLLPLENFDFNSSKMTGSVFKNNKRKV